MDGELVESYQKALTYWYNKAKALEKELKECEKNAGAGIATGAANTPDGETKSE